MTAVDEAGAGNSLAPAFGERQVKSSMHGGLAKSPVRIEVRCGG
jgi:hypothetical protein